MSEFYLTACLKFMTLNQHDFEMPNVGIPLLKIMFCDHLIFNMGIPIPGQDVFYIETGPWTFSFIHFRHKIYNLSTLWEGTKSRSNIHLVYPSFQILLISIFNPERKLSTTLINCLVNFSSQNANGLEWNSIYRSSFPVYYNDRHNYSSCYICWWIDMTDM